MEQMELFADALLYHRAKQNWNRKIHFVSIMYKLIYKQFYTFNTHNVYIFNLAFLMERVVRRVDIDPVR